MKGKNISYSYNSSDNIVIAEIQHTIDIEDIKLHYEILHQHYLGKKDVKVLILGKAFQFNVLGSDLRGAKKSILNRIKDFDSLTEAIVTIDAFATAIAMIFEELYKLPNYSFKVYSEEENGLKWLKQVHKVK